MSAENYDVLYDLESQIEEAFATAIEPLAAANAIQCVTQRSDEELETPRYEFQFTTGASTGHEGQAKDLVHYPDGWTGTLRVRTVTARREDIAYTDHRRYVACARKYLYQYVSILNDTHLPHLFIKSVLETGSSQGTDADHEHDITELNFALAVYIRPEAWPLP